jgi:membrane associated rhomboid family serine protease
MLLPIGRDDSVIQRHAYVSYAIIAINVLVFIFTATIDESAQQKVIQQRYRETLSYFIEHPYLTPPEQLSRLLSKREQKYLKAIQHPREGELRGPAIEQQRTLDLLADRLDDELHKLTVQRIGYVPSRPSAASMFTSMFVHGGLMHLIGNLLFFFVTGPFLEDVFGRPMFAFLYFSGGVVATMTYAMHFRESAVPLIGASGAIAAIMGAYLVRFLRSRLEFIWILYFYRPYRFFLPAFVVLPFWFLEQLFMASMASEGSGVAFWAHVGGFAYGAAVALALKFTGFEEKYVVPVIAKETTWVVDESLNQATYARHLGDLASAQKQITSFLAKDPNSVEGLRVAIDIALDAEDHRMTDTCATRLFDQYLKLEERELAVDLAQELCANLATLRMPRFYARVATYVERTDYDWALSLYQRLCQMDPNSATTVRNMMKMGMLLRAKGNPEGARRAYEAARRHPACSADFAPAIEAKLGQLNPQ